MEKRVFKLISSAIINLHLQLRLRAYFVSYECCKYVIQTDFIKSTDHLPTDHRPTDHRPLTRQPTDPPFTDPLTHRPNNHI